MRYPLGPPIYYEVAVHPSLENRYLIRVKYSDTEIGYSCATTPSYPKSDSFHKPNAAIAVFTEQGAKLNVKALKTNWDRDRSWRPHITIPVFEIVPIAISEK